MKVPKIFKSSKTEPTPYVCAFIPQDILEHVANAPDIDEEVRQSLRSTIATSEEAHKDRVAVGDSDANPHEPNLPPADAKAPQLSGTQDSEAETQDGRAEVLIFNGFNSDYAELPGLLLRKSGQGPVTDSAANDCYWTMNHAQTFFRHYYGWDSLDDKNHALIGTVHARYNMANAYYIGGRNQMLFGNGNQYMYNFAKSWDVVGHELTHGIIQFSSGLIYNGMSGALNEHCADVFGSLLEQCVLKQTVEQADWLLAQDVLFPGDDRIAMRSMKAPGTAYDDPRVGKDTQPAHMKDYVYTQNDHGGVHINSGIPNKAFYLAATRKGGYAWETAGKTWFAAMTTAKPNSTFGEFALLTIREANKLVDPSFAPIIEQAWTDVGVLPIRSGWMSWLWGKKA